MKNTLVIILLILSTAVSATTYYIDPAGNNSNDGSVTHPWLTLTYACAHTKTSGDIIHVNAGTFVETDDCNLAVGVSLTGTGTGSVIKSTVTGNYRNIVVLSSASENTAGNQSISNLKFDGTNYTMAYAIYISQRGLVNIHDCTFIHFNRGAVQFSGHEGGAEPTTYAVGNQVYNNIATDCGNFFLTQNYLTSAFQEIGQDQMLIHDNTITQTGRTYGTNGVGIAAHYLKGMKIYNNTITTDPNMGNDYSTYGSAVSTFVIELWNVTGGVEIYNNNFYNGTLDIAGDYNTKGAYAYSVSTHNNKFSRAMGNIVKDAIELEMAPPFDNILIYDNWIENYSRGMTIYNEGVGTFSNISIYYNVFNNIGTTNANNSYFDAWGIEFNGYFASTINNLNIWNNTIIGHVGGSAVGGIGFVGEGTYTNVSIKNNIIMNFTGQAPVYNQGGGGLAMSSYIVNNNDFYNNGNSNLVRDNGITPTNYNFTSGYITTIFLLQMLSADRFTLNLLLLIHRMYSDISVLLTLMSQAF